MSRLINSFISLFRRSADDGATAKKRSTRSGANVYSFAPSNEQALSIAAVYRCVQLLSDSVAGLQLQYLRSKDGRYLVDEGSPYHYLLSVQPQPELSIYGFWSETMRQILMKGNAYIYPRRIKGEVTDLVLCHRNTVSHDVINNKYTINDPYNGVYGTFDESEIIHLYIHSSDGRRGESVISHARRTLTIATVGDEETASRFANGGNVRGIVTNDKSAVGFGEYQDEELEKTARDIDDRFRGGDRIVSLPGQVDFKQISLSSTDMQFLESRKFTVREVCRFFGVHPSFVFDDTSTNYKSAESANVAFLTMTLDPILKRIEAEFTRKLIPQSLCCKRIFRFDRRGVYSLDLEAKADYQKKTIESGVYTVNDWRRFENQPTVEGGDTVYISTNLAPLGSSKLAGGSAE